MDLKHIPTTTIGYKLPPGMYEIIDINFLLKSLLPKEVKVDITVDDIRLKSSLTTNKTIKITKKSFLYIILGFTLSPSGELGDIEGFVQLIAGSNKSDKPVNITGIDKIQLKCDFTDGSRVNGIQVLILYNVALFSPPGHKI